MKTLFAKLLFFILLAFSCEAGSKNEYLFVDLTNNRCGMFSVFNYVVGVLYHYEHGDYAGIKIDFQNKGLYYQKDRGENWWQYYCEPVEIGNPSRLRWRNSMQNKYEFFSMFTESQLSTKQVHEIIRKYFKFKPLILHKIDEFVSKNFKEEIIISVHYRGTDKKIEAPLVDFRTVKSAIETWIANNSITNYQILAASDEQEFIDFIKKSFPEKVISYNAMRSNKKKPLHTRMKDNMRYQQGEEALVECLLLSKGNVLIRNSSNLGLWATYLNPSLPEVLLNDRYKR